MENLLDYLKFEYTQILAEFLKNIPNYIAAIILLLLFIILAWLTHSPIKNALNKKSSDPLLANFLSKIVKWFIIILGIVFASNIIGLGKLAGGIVAGAGVGAFIIGFAFKDIGENFLAGIIMAFSRPFRVNDTVEVNGVTGNVIALGFRHTHLKTFDGRDVYIPNGAIIKNNLFNYTIDGFLRSEFQLQFNADVEVNKVIDIVLASLKEEAGIVSEKPSIAFVKELTANGLTMVVRFWVNTYDKTISTAIIKTNAISNCVKQLKANNINLLGSGN